MATEIIAVDELPREIWAVYYLCDDGGRLKRRLFCDTKEDADAFAQSTFIRSAHIIRYLRKENDQ